MAFANFCNKKIHFRVMSFESSLFPSVCRFHVIRVKNLSAICGFSPCSVSVLPAEGSFAFSTVSIKLPSDSDRHDTASRRKRLACVILVCAMSHLMIVRTIWHSRTGWHIMISAGFFALLAPPFLALCRNEKPNQTCIVNAPCNPILYSRRRQHHLLAGR